MGRSSARAKTELGPTRPRPLGEYASTVMPAPRAARIDQSLAFRGKQGTSVREVTTDPSIARLWVETLQASDPGDEVAA